jgi:hypothetical protein
MVGPWAAGAWVGKDERLDGVVVQTVGEKSYDGFLVAVAR